MAYVSTGESIDIEKGMQAGIQVGIQQGLQQGEAMALQKLLNKRFGVITPAMAAQIATADTVQIGIWFDRAIDAPSLSAVFADTPPSSH